MNTIESKDMPELLAELQEAVAQAAKGIRDPEAIEARRRVLEPKTRGDPSADRTSGHRGSVSS